jgi:hypothetical protein
MTTLKHHSTTTTVQAINHTQSPIPHSTTNTKLASSLTTVTSTTINKTLAASKNRAHEPTQPNNNQQPNLNLGCDTRNHRWSNEDHDNKEAA